jgi:hypothetical protein
MIAVEISDYTQDPWGLPKTSPPSCRELIDPTVSKLPVYRLPKPLDFGKNGLVM